jgi:protein-tyrosine phosphatase
MGGVRTIKLAELSSERRQSTLHAAADALRDAKGIVIAGSEAGYVALASDTSHDASVLRDEIGLGAWWCASRESLLKTFPHLTAQQQRLVRKLSPGCVLWRIGLNEDTEPTRAFSDAVYARRDPRRVSVRLADASVASTIAALAESRSTTPTPPAIILWSLVTPDGSSCRTCEEAMAAVDRLPAEIMVASPIDTGTTIGPRDGLTTILLTAAGGVHVEKEGVYERRHVMANAAFNVLFVCTGNTCRSPMAEAIANGLARQLELADTIRFSSAGVSAGPGAPATPEAVHSVKELGYSMSTHRSRPVTRELIQSADAIFTMTEGHLNAVLAIDPDAESRACMLDATGRDVPDPIGHGPEVYTASAHTIRSLLENRLKEFAR